MVPCTTFKHAISFYCMTQKAFGIEQDSEQGKYSPAVFNSLHLGFLLIQWCLMWVCRSKMLYGTCGKPQWRSAVESPGFQRKAMYSLARNYLPFERQSGLVIVTWWLDSCQWMTRIHAIWTVSCGLDVIWPTKSESQAYWRTPHQNVPKAWTNYRCR